MDANFLNRYIRAGLIPMELSFEDKLSLARIIMNASNLIIDDDRNKTKDMRVNVSFYEFSNIINKSIKYLFITDGLKNINNNVLHTCAHNIFEKEKFLTNIDTEEKLIEEITLKYKRS